MKIKRIHYVIVTIVLVLIGVLINIIRQDINQIVPVSMCNCILIELGLYAAVRIYKPNGLRILPFLVFITMVIGRLLYCIFYCISRSDYLQVTVTNILRKYDGEILISIVFGFTVLLGYQIVLSSWEKAESATNDESGDVTGNRKAMGCLKGCLTVLIINVVVIVAIVFAVKVLDLIPTTVDKQTNGEYTVELCAIGSPEWPFGSQEGKVVLSYKRDEISSYNFTLHNDGKNMGIDNWKVSWETNYVVITIMGEEQPDEIITLNYD